METIQMPINRLIEAENVVSTDNAMFPGHKKDEVMVDKCCEMWINPKKCHAYW